MLYCNYNVIIIICYYYVLKINSRFQPKVCGGCHDLFLLK